MPSNFDSRWLDGIHSNIDDERLLQQLGAEVTSYGIVSKRYGSLFALTGYDELEKYELIEVCGQPALFSDARIHDSEVPERLYRYDIRRGENDLLDGTIESNVYVDHGGSILVQQPFEFGEDGYIQLDEDSSPNFTGEEMTAVEFAARDFTEDSDEVFDIGGMSI